MSRRNKWLVGETVVIDLHGTEVEGTIKRAPLVHDDAWVHQDAPYWLVEVEDFGTVEVLNGRAV